MTPEQSRRFLKFLGAGAIIWLILGIILTQGTAEATRAFVEVYFFALLDLVFLLLIFWKAFFQKTNPIQMLIFVLFKLVCLGFLVITLKRFRNAPFLSLLLGVVFIGFGPMVAGIFSRRNSVSAAETKEK